MSNIKNSSISTKPLTSERLLILPLHHVQATELLKYYSDNRDFFRPTSPTPTNDFYTEEYWQRKIWQARQDWQQQRAALFVLKERSQRTAENSIIIGSVNFNQVIHGVLQSCFLGYSMDKDYQGMGLMTEALIELTEYMFEDWKLHRIQANYLESNNSSARVLAKLGFEKEGFAKKYLKINGTWQDHILTAKVNPNDQD
jgi:ribosomal-protein-alanine N-acetyltransferase